MSLYDDTNPAHLDMLDRHRANSRREPTERELRIQEMYRRINFKTGEVRK